MNLEDGLRRIPLPKLRYCHLAVFVQWLVLTMLCRPGISQSSGRCSLFDKTNKVAAAAAVDWNRLD